MRRTEGLRYYNLSRNWRKLEPHLSDPLVSAVLVRDFNRYTWGRWRQKFQPGMVPRDFESCDWGIDHKGPEPRFWAYVKHAACHWLVNFNLRLAERVVPRRPWRILTSDRHSTVWDGGNVLFDFNLLALGVPAEECYELACGVQLPVGEELRVHLAQHYKTAGEAVPTQGERRKGWRPSICLPPSCARS